MTRHRTREHAHLPPSLGARLDRVAAPPHLFGDLTEDVLLRAGISPGMHVLDVGCGRGDVTLLAAKLVGPTGRVIGIDRSVDALTIAASLAAALGLDNVSFREADLRDFVLDDGVDAIVGRYVLVHQDDYGGAMRRLARSLRPGGVMAFHEMVLSGGLESSPRCALLDRCAWWLRETYRRAGLDERAGLRLHAAFVEAGLGEPRMVVRASAQGASSAALFTSVAALVRALLPRIVQLGVASPAEVDVDTLADRLRAEATGLGAVVTSPLLVGAWARRAERGIGPHAEPASGESRHRRAM
jgi:SAM-dependent methyltransferase